MTNLRIKWALFIFTVLLFGWYLLPTIRFYSLPANPPAAAAQPTQPNPVVPPPDSSAFSVPTPEGETSTSTDGTTDTNFRYRGSANPSIAKLRENAMKLGLDLQGGVYLVYEVDLSKIPPKDRRGDEVDRAM